MSDETVRDVLIDAAKKAIVHSYSPYSRFAVGAALMTVDGTIVTGMCVTCIFAEVHISIY